MDIIVSFEKCINGLVGEAFTQIGTYIVFLYGLLLLSGFVQII